MAACAYSQLSHNMQLNLGLRLFKLVDFKPGDNVLDVGCGSGNLTSIVAQKVGLSGRVLGIDPDVERIAVAKRTCLDQRNVNFVCCKSIDFPTDDRKRYDTIYSIAALHWIRDEEKLETFRRIHAALNDEGKFVFVATRRLPGNMLAILERSPPNVQQKYNDMFHFCSRERYEEIAQSTGFVVQSSQEATVETGPLEEDAYYAWMEATLYGHYEFSTQIDKGEVTLDRCENSEMVTHITRIVEMVLRKA